MGSASLSFLGSQPIAMLLVYVYPTLVFNLIVVSFSSSVFLFRCVLHPLPSLAFMPGLYSTTYRATFPAFYAVASSLFLLFV